MTKISKFLDQQWSRLSLLRTTPILRIGYGGVVLIPIFSYLILGADETITRIYDVINHYLQVIGADPSNSYTKPHFHLPCSLFSTFIASILLSIGHFLNEAFCPPLIKQHLSINEYSRIVARDIQNSLIIQNKLVTEKEDIVKKRLSNFGEHNKKIIAEAIIETIFESEKRDHQNVAKELSSYKSEWHNENISKPSLRKLIISLYIIAAGILLILLLRQISIVFTATYFT